MVIDIMNRQAIDGSAHRGTVLPRRHWLPSMI